MAKFAAVGGGVVPAGSGGAAVVVAAPTGVAATDTANIQAALTSVGQAGGGTVQLRAGTYKITGGVLKIAHPEVSLVGAGANATVLQRAANGGLLLDISGVSTDYNTMLFRVRVADLMISGNNMNGDLVRSYYSQFMLFERVNFYASNGAGFNAVQCWDSLFYRCRWDYIHGVWYEPVQSAAVHLKVADQGVASGFGYSPDGCNNINFFECTWEQNSGCDVWFDGRNHTGAYTARHNECTFSGRTKMEEATNGKARPFLILDNVDDITFDALQISLRGAYQNVPLDMVRLIRADYIDIRHYRPESIEYTTPGIRTFVAVGQATRFLRLDMGARAETVNKPTVAAIEYSGTGRTDNLVTAGFLTTPGGVALTTGTGPNNP